MNYKGKIIYTGAFRFPDGDAAAARVLGIGKALRESGFEVEFAGWEECERDLDLQEDGSHRFDGFRYTSQADLRFQPLSPFKRLQRYFAAGSNTLSWLRAQQLCNVKAIIAYHGSSIFLQRLAVFCRESKIRLFVDCTEWYDSRHLPGGPLGPVSLDNALRMRILNTRIGNIIAVSRYLEKYYADKGCHVVNVPPLVDLQDRK